MFNIRFYAIFFSALFVSFFAFCFVANAAPVISSIDPTQAVPGSTVIINGTDLTDKVELKLGTGNPVSVPAIVDEAKTVVQFEIPLEIQPGDHEVSVIAGSARATSPTKLRVTVGGAPFRTGPKPTAPTQGLPTDLGQLIQQIFTWSLGILGISVFVMFFYAGFLWLTAAGNTSKVSDAKSRMTNAIFGAIILLSSYLILNTINPDFVRSSVNLPGLGN